MSRLTQEELIRDPRLRLIEVDEAGSVECFLCGKKGYANLMCKVEGGYFPEVRAHGSCINGRTPRQVKREYKKAMRELFPTPTWIERLNAGEEPFQIN